MSKLVPGKLYSHTEVSSARTRGRLIGWVQGAVTTFAVLWLLKLVGWIPALIVIGVVGFLAFKLLFGKKE